MKRTGLCLVYALTVVAAFAATVHASTIYGVVNRYNDGHSYQFGSFDLSNPDTSGGAGNYTYQWTSLGDNHRHALANLAMKPDGSMYINYEFGEHRAISTNGVIGSKLGDLPGPYALFGMAFNSAGNLYGTDGSDWMQLDPDTGSASSRITMTDQLYSGFGGNLAWSAGKFYFAEAAYGDLYSITTSGSQTKINAFSGTDYDYNYAMVLFEAGGQMYMLNSARLYTVNLDTAELTKLGSVTGLPSDFNYSFTGAVTANVVPEPATIMLIAPGAGLLLFIRHRMRYYLS